MKNRIYIKHWQLLKPQNYSSNTDLYYLDIANKVYANLDEASKSVLLEYLNEDDVKILCCFFTCYFEDIISETNIWGTFKSEYKKIYKKTLPFYEIDNTYETDEINSEDIAFLTWYFLNTMQNHHFINPVNRFIFDIAYSTLAVFDAYYEYAPENKKLKSYFSIKELPLDFYECRSFIQHVFFDSYLFFTDVKQRLELDIFDVLETQSDTIENPEIANTYIREITEEYTFNKKSMLLAFSAKDWAAALIGKKHSLYNKLKSISTKVFGFFLYKNQDEYCFYLEHIASGYIFNVTKKSFDYYKDLKEDSIIQIGLTQWNNEWWFSGTFSASEFDADLILDEKNSTKSRSDVNFLNDSKKEKAIIKHQKALFLKYNNGKPIAFLMAKDVDRFTLEFIDFYNASLGLSKKEKEAALKRKKADGFLAESSGIEPSDLDENPVVVFFNPKSGLEIYQNVINAFPDKDNPFFTEENPMDIMLLLINDFYSKELVEYVIDTYEDKLEFFKNEQSQVYLDNIDFLLRFWKKEAYHTKSTLISIGKNNTSSTL